MTWYAVVDKATGEAVSFGTVLGELVDHLEAIQILEQPDRTKRWDAATKTIVDVPPPPDAVATLLNDPTVSAITSKLSKGEKAALEEKLRAVIR